MERYIMPTSYFIALNLVEHIAKSVEHGEKFDNYLSYPQADITPAQQEIMLSFYDGDFNRELLNSLLKNQNVRLKRGVYPMSPGVVIDGTTLDMNGSEFESTEARFTGAFITMIGSSPKILNGRLHGKYTIANGEPNYISWNREYAILLPVGCYSNAEISGCSFDHWHGDAIRSDNSLDKNLCIDHPASQNPNEIGRCAFDLTGNSHRYCYIFARNLLEKTSNLISERDIVYEFYNRSNGFIGSACGMPGVPVKRPPDCVRVIATTYSADNVSYVLFESAHDNSVKIENCYFWCNARFGIANLCGNSEVISCVSDSNGYPTIFHETMTCDCLLSGFINALDTHTPILSVVNCVSRNENLGIASKAYILNASENTCPICIHNGWRANIIRHDGRVSCNSEDVKSYIQITDSQLNGMSEAKIGTNMHISNCIVELCDTLNRLPGFKTIVDEYEQIVPVRFDGIVKGTITGEHDVMLKLATKPGSDLHINLPSDGLYGVRAADGDCWGIHSNALILPNGHEIAECVFQIADDRYYRMSVPEFVSKAFTGKYTDCIFSNTASDTIFKASAARIGDPIKISFERCRFLLDGAFLFDDKLKNGSEVQFIDCTIDGKPIGEDEARRIVARDVGKIAILINK